MTYLEVALASSHKKLGHLKPTRALDKAEHKLTALLTTSQGGRPLISYTHVACLLFPILE